MTGIMMLRVAPPLRSLEKRLWAKVGKGGLNECWLWQGGKSNGYGYINLGPGLGQDLVHRVVYRMLIGPIPEGTALDHVCHNADEHCRGGADCLHRSCVNPRHLEPTTLGDNVLRGRGITAQNARKTHCPAGHPYDEVNTYLRPDGARECRACSRVKNRYAARRRYVPHPRPPKTHCVHGHPLDDALVGRQNQGRYIHRACRVCSNARSRRYQRNRRRREKGQAL